MATQDIAGLVIHVSSVNDRSTEVVMSERIRIGAGEDCDVKIRLPRPSEGAVMELARLNGSYRVERLDPDWEVKLNGKRIKPNAEIEDGDEAWISPAGPSLHFFPVGATPALVPGRRGSAHVAPFIEQAAMESSSTARRDDAKIFLREFTRELVREINPSTKIVTFGIIIVLVLGILYIGFGLYNEIKRTRQIVGVQGAQLTQAQQEAAKAREELARLLRSNEEIRDSLSLAPKLRSVYGSGVCLIYGSYVFVESGTGRPLRYPETQTNESGEAIQDGNESSSLTPEGHGQIAEFEFIGTGFHAGEGFVVTNRHVAQPWEADDRAQSLNGSVRGQPRLKKLMAFFPDHNQPIPLKFKQAAQRDDVAVCILDARDIEPRIPVMPLDRDSDSVVVGKMVVTMGYPSGLDRLLALLDENEARGIQARYASVGSQLGYLAETKRIQPLMTQGNITDIDVRKVVYDARTGEGGSGAPLFGPSGRVIGVTYAVFTENTASNYAVPIRYAITLLARAGWKPPEGIEGEQSANNSQTNARPN